MIQHLARGKRWSERALLLVCVSAAACADAADPPAPLPATASVSGSGSASGGPRLAPAQGVAGAGLAREGSSLAISDAEDRLYLADEDGAALRVVPLPLAADRAPTRKETPGRPAQVVVLGSTLLVTVRLTPDGGGALLVYDTATADPVESSRIALPRDAWGIATSPDGKTAAVTSAWAGQVSLVDLEQHKVVWTRDVAREPRGVLFSADGNSVFVSHLVGANLTRIDDVGNEARVTAVELPASPIRSPAAEKLPASLGYALVANAERDRLFAPRHALGALGNNQWFGTAAVDALDLVDGKPVATARTVNAHKSFIQPVASTMTGRAAPWWTGASDVVTAGALVFTQPRAAVFRKKQGTLLIASEGSDKLVELDAAMSDPTLGLVRVYDLGADSDPTTGGATCGAPTGIALAANEQTAFVHCRSTDEIVAVLLPEGEGDYAAPRRAFTRFAEPSANGDFAAGRRLFYDATDSYVSGGLGCAGCHPDGRDDGFVWHEVEFAPAEGKTGSSFTNFFGSASLARSMTAFWDSSPIRNASESGVGYARQTPIIAGRLKSKGPYGWRAESATLDARLRAGFDLHRWNGSSNAESGFPPVRARQLAAFVREGLVPPPLSSAPLSAEEARGKQIFSSEKVGCSTCHVPETDYTNRSIAAFAPFPQRGYADEKAASYKTPSLLFVAGSAPYFHDGRYATLDDVINKNFDQMGKTSHLSDDEKRALVAFLRRL